MGERRPEHSLVEPLVQLFKDPSSSGQIFRPLLILHQLFNDRRINPRLLAFLALLFSLLLLGHFHLLSHVVTHTQNFPTPSLMVWQPHYGPVRQLAAGLVRSKRAKRRLVVKAARQLAIDLWRLATEQTTAEKLGLIMHSDRRRN